MSLTVRTRDAMPCGRPATRQIVCSMIAIGLAAGLAPAANAGPDLQPTEVVDVSATHTIVISPCEPAPASSSPKQKVGKTSHARGCEAFYMTTGDPIIGLGELTLFIQPTSLAEIEVFYSNREDSEAVPSATTLKLKSCAESETTQVSACIANSSTLEKTSLSVPTAVHLRFALHAGQLARALGGFIYVRGVGQPSKPTAIAVAASVEALPEVRIEPTAIKLNAGHGDGQTVTVSASGPGVRRLVETQPAAPLTGVLHDPSGRAATVQLGSFKFAEDAKSSKALSLTATVPITLTSHPATGTYKGKLFLSALDTAGPSIEVEVNKRLSIWLALLFVFVGVGIATFAAPLWSLRRRGKNLTKILSKTTVHYWTIRRKLSADQLATLWSPGKLVPVEAAVVPPTSLTVEQLAEQITTERDDADFNEDRDLVLDVIASTSRWLRLAPAALRLQFVTDASSGITSSTATKRATDTLMVALRREPSDAKAADELVEQVLDQTLWHAGYAAVGTKLTATGSESDLDRLKELDAKYGAKSILALTSVERTEFLAGLEALVKDFGVDVNYQCHPVNAIERVDWSVSPNRFTGWSAIDGTRFSSLKIESGSSYRTATRDRHDTDWGSEALWSVGIAVVVSAAYTLSIYNSTWGSLKDVITALTAGATGSVAIKTALPIFTSQRLRAAAKP